MEKQYILIDALHITMGGGKVLLDYLVDKLLEQGVAFMLLRDIRCKKLKNENQIDSVVVLSDNWKDRWQFYAEHKNDFDFVLCFGNIPTPIKMKCPVYTYVHNVNLLKIPKEYSLKRKIVTWLKQKYISYYSKNTDGWIVQTSNTEDCLRRTLPCKGKVILQLPFYDISPDFFDLKFDRKQRKDYVLIGDYTGTRGHDELVKAWKILSKQGFKGRLHLTLSDGSHFPMVVEDAIKEGADIVNHGIVSFDKIIELYGICKATIYPSKNESLGLGVIEAIYAGCDVIGADLPYLHSICVPSMTFKAGNVHSIVNAILRYERDNCRESKLMIMNQIDELVALVTSNGNRIESERNKVMYYTPSQLTVGGSQYRIKVLLWSLVKQYLFKSSPTKLSCWRVWLLRQFGAKVGSHCYISNSVDITNPWELVIGNYVTIDDGCWIDAPVTLDDWCGISKCAKLIADGHNVRSRSFDYECERIFIGARAFIGCDSYIGMGVQIGQFACVGARSVILKNVPDNMIAYGSHKVTSERIPKDEYLKYRFK